MSEHNKTPKCLIPALRQYRHNRGDGLVAAYDYDLVNKEIATKDAELARLREALDMPDDYILLPVKPTYELVVAMAVKKWPDIWEKGKKLQMELGCEVVPPNAECEEAAGTYMQLIEALRSQ